MGMMVEVTPDDSAMFKSVVNLGNRNRKYLGFLPEGAIRAMAEKGHLVALLDGSELAGYALYDIARMRVRLIHLCVDDGHRRKGVAKRLVDYVSKKHADLAGIVARCRRDYKAATAAWPSLGFMARAEKPGRGSNGAVLVIWWRSHGVPDLFSDILDEDLITVAIDRNVALDLTTARDRVDAEFSQALEADWLSGEIQLAVGQEVYNEILDIEDSSEREQHRRALTRFHELTITPSQWDEAWSRVGSAFVDLPPSDGADQRHIIGAAAGGADVFVTRDEKLIHRYADIAISTLGLKILHPSSLIARFDEVVNSALYRPVDLVGTEIEKERFGAEAGVHLEGLLDNARGERRYEYRKRVRELIADSRTRRWAVRSDSGIVIAAWATRPSEDGHSLEVPLFRFGEKSRLGVTIGRLIIFQIKQEALSLGKPLVHICDPHPPRRLLPSLIDDGFVTTERGLSAVVLRAHSQQDLCNLSSQHSDIKAVIQKLSTGLEPVAQLARLERSLWPTKFFDSDIPNYLIPIKREWAVDLLQFESTLLSRPTVLGLSRELVYYRTPVNSPSAPARIIWYVSGTDTHGVGAAVAASRLTEVVRGAPGRLHEKYEQLGVYRLKDVEASARNKQTEALKFADTEVFTKHVPLERMRVLGGGRFTSTLQSPTRVENDLWQRIYLEGNELVE